MTSDRPPSPSLEQTQRITHIQFSIWHTFKRHIPNFLATIFFDIILPLIIYFCLQKHIKPVYALLVAGISPLFMIIYKAIRSQTFDALGFLVFIGFIISAIIAILTRNPIVLLLEKSLVTGIISLVFFITLIPFHFCRFRPFAYYFYQDLVPTNREQVGLPKKLFINEQESIDEHEVLISKLSDKQEVAQVYEWIYTHCSSFRLACYIITSIWAVGLLSEFLARLTLILARLSVNKIVIYGNVIFSSVTIICILTTIICIIRERKQTILLIEQWKTNI